MVWNWLKGLIKPSKEEQEFFDSLDKFFKEYDVVISQYVEKHLEKLAKVFPETRGQIRKNARKKNKES